MMQSVTQNRHILPAAKPSVARDDHQGRAFDVLVGFHEWVADIRGGARQIGDEFRELLGVGFGGGRPVQGGLEARRGDELHGPRDLADVAH